MHGSLDGRQVETLHYRSQRNPKALRFAPHLALPEALRCQDDGNVEKWYGRIRKLGFGVV